MDLKLLEPEERAAATEAALDAAGRVADWIENDMSGRDDVAIKSAPFVEECGDVLLVLVYEYHRVDFRISKNGERLSVIAVDENARAAQMQLSWNEGSVCLLLDWLLRA